MSEGVVPGDAESGCEQGSALTGDGGSHVPRYEVGFPQIYPLIKRGVTAQSNLYHTSTLHVTHCPLF